MPQIGIALLRTLEEIDAALGLPLHGEDNSERRLAEIKRLKQIEQGRPQPVPATSALIAPKGWTSRMWELIDHYKNRSIFEQSCRDLIKNHLGLISEVSIDPEPAFECNDWDGQDDPKCLYDGKEACIDCLCIGHCIGKTSEQEGFHV